MSALDFNQIEAPLNAFDALLKPVEPAVYAGQAFLNVRHADFHVLHIGDEQIDALFNARQARLNLLKHRDDEVGDFAHADQHICSCDVPQVAGETH